jgi:DNA-binding GntR family transcriptional regulator
VARTTRYIELLGEEMLDDPRYSSWLTPRVVDLIAKAAPLHDIGKVGIPDSILLKPAKLTADEFELMKTHAAIGRNALSIVAGDSSGGNEFLRHAIDITGSHHERWNGSGYPDGLSGEEIPLSARLMALADVYDALTCARVYKRAMAHEEARALIVEAAGRHFDPAVVEAFLKRERDFAEIAEALRKRGEGSSPLEQLNFMHFRRNVGARVPTTLFCNGRMVLRDAMSHVGKTVLSQQIIDALRDRIVFGGFDPGQPIRQDALAAELGISKIPLREAMAKLEQEGLIVSRVNRGFFVSPLSATEALDVFDLRYQLEPAATAAASLRVTDDDIRAAREALAELDGAMLAAQRSAGALNRAFHLALIRPCGKPVTVQLVWRLLLLSERYTVKHLEPSGRLARARSEHQGLLEAWAVGDAQRVEKLVAVHISGTREDLARELEACEALT